MSGNCYPITEFGILRLVERLIQSGVDESRYEECDVEVTEDVELKDHLCTRIQIIHPKRRKHFQNFLTRIDVDEQLQLPIRFESYDWPDAEGSDPVLKEEYMYHRLKLNVGLTEADFERDNSGYNFSMVRQNLR